MPFKSKEDLLKWKRNHYQRIKLEDPQRFAAENDRRNELRRARRAAEKEQEKRWLALV